MKFNKLSASDLWLFVAIGLLMHSGLEVMESVYFSSDDAGHVHDEEVANGIPMASQIIFLAAMVIPFMMSFVTPLIQSKGFIWFSFIFAIVLALLNSMHWVEALTGNPGNIVQVVLLLFIVVVNIYLVLNLNEARKSLGTVTTATSAE